MSLSSLSAQLASLNASNTKNAGSSLGTSKRHDDAIGRGLAHSATHGHALAATSNPRFQPSVLYADSREASDVPLTTLRENCASCLSQLARDTLNNAFCAPDMLQTLAGTKSLSYERGLATRAENDKLDETIIQLLSLLSTTMGESSVSCLQSSLHVIEYLLRRYEIHARANTAENLLLAFLPHHEQPVFLRVLQLIDLASMPTWVFLRPYAQKGAQPPSRSLLAKRAARDNALVSHCCQMAKTAAQLHADECFAHDADPLTAPRRGISRVISFAAAVLVEAMSIQTTIPANQGSLAEPTVRCVFPFVLNACGDNHKSTGYSLGVTCPDWRGFGHVLAATLAEKSVLAPDVRQVLCTTIVKGALETDRALHGITMEPNQHVQVAADYMLAVMTVLSKNVVVENSQSTLQVLVSNKDHNVERRVGYDLAPATFKILLKNKWLAQALGCLNDERDIAVAPMLASLLALAMDKVLNEPLHKKAASSLQLILELLQEESLASVWRDEKVNLTASFASALILAVANKHDKDTPTESLDAIRSFLDGLRAVNPIGCDAGIANAVSVACSKGGGKGSRSSRKKRVALLLGLKTAGSSHMEKHGGASGGDLDSTLLLPARVALEHPEATVRLNAIERVVDEASGMDVKETGEPLEVALLRRINTDENVQVAAAAGGALVTLLETRNANTFDDKFAEMALNALCKWCVFQNEFAVPNDSTSDKSKTKKKKSKKEKSEPTESRVANERLEVLDSVLTISAYVLRSLIQGRNDEPCDIQDSLTFFVQAIVAHLDFAVINEEKQNDDDAEKIVFSASKALQFAFDIKPKKKGKGKATTSLDVAKAILRNDLCSSVLQAVCSSSTNQPIQNSTLLALQRRYLWVIVATLSDAIDAQDALAASLYILNSYQDGKTSGDINESGAIALLKSLRICAKEIAARNVESVPDIISSLSSISSSKAYEQVCAPAIQEFCNNVVLDNGSTVSPIAVVMEAATRLDMAGESVERLLSVANKSVASGTHDVSLAGCASGVVPALMLTGHSDQRVRKMALQLLSSIAQQLENDNESAVSDEYAVLKDVCKVASKDQGADGLYSSLLMDGESALPKLVARAVQVSKEPSRLRESLIRRCLMAATARGGISDSGETVYSKPGWLPFARARGGCRAAASVLKALEFAGEAAYPLSLRWEMAGKQLFREMLHLKFVTEDDTRTGTVQLQDLVDSVVTMLKGVVVIDEALLDREGSHVVISSGPTRKGRRSRSYSVGKVDGVSFMESYPKVMYDALVESISSPFGDTIGSNAFARELCDALICNVFTRSWGNGVFKKMPSEQRRTIAFNLLYLRSRQDVVSAGLALFDLPMNASDILFLLKEAKKKDDYLVAVTFLCDWIRMNGSNSCHDPGTNEVITHLFEVLGSLSSTSDSFVATISDADGAEYARMSILQTLLSLSDGISESNASGVSKKRRKELSGQVDLLVRLVGCGAEDGAEGNSSFLPVASGKAKTFAISLLTKLCSQHPSAVVTSLIPALLNTMVSSSSENGQSIRASRSAGETFLGVVPVFCLHASSAGLSLLDLFSRFVVECQRLPDHEDRLVLYRNLVDALVSVQTIDDCGRSLGSLLGVFLASEVFRSAVGSDERRSSKSPTPTEIGAQEFSDMEMTEKGDVPFALDVLQFAPPAEQISSMLQLLHYANQSFIKLGSKELGSGGEVVEVSMESSASKGAVGFGFEEVETIALFGPTHSDGSSDASNSEYSIEQRRRIMGFASHVLTVFQEALSTGAIRKFIKKSDDSQSALCLRIWQDLLCLQAAASDARSASLQNVPSSNADEKSYERNFFDSSRLAIGETLEYLQNLLPAHLFLASATSLISDDNTGGELRAKAIRLVAERAAEAEPNSAEASLFLDIVALFVELLQKVPSEDPEYMDETNILLQQSSLIAIEHLARALCLPSGPKGDAGKNAAVFLDALEQVTTILGDNSENLHLSGDLSAIETASIQLLCSSALCASTLVRVFKARCLPFLPKIAGPLLETLASTNSYLLKESGELDPEKKSTVKMLQLSILRAVVAIADTLPQFLLPYLGKLLSPSGLQSRALRDGVEEQDDALSVAIEQLETTLSTRTPSRQLVPAVCKASSACRGQYREFEAMLSILEVAIQHASRGELPSLTNWVLKTLMMAYEHDGSDGDQIRLFSAANKVLLALVFKLSEAQLRPLYAKLREWRGDLENSSDNKLTASKRLAFWSLSSVLSKELRTIFLPCLSTVVSDAVEELELAATKLHATKSSKKLADGRKKRRLALSSSDGDADEDNMESLRTLQPVLSCLESALNADAHEGGSWARADDGQRFNALLSPLGKLLQCKIPADFPVLSSSSEKSKPSSATPFQQIVEGAVAEDSGNVRGCLTALASAAGNEQLWKPLNHVVLEACGNEGRSEVRKAGVSCLLSLIKALGEEYMVLLPECLPVLSELLEDTDEDIAALARECVSLGEDLLGESLQDSLR